MNSCKNYIFCERDDLQNKYEVNSKLLTYPQVWSPAKLLKNININ